ncbi:MAG: branched-chain amino acid transport system II carrier protein [Anaerococcus sp.]|nr:branched-chain amino acid transport system II carrier protein [Anaerococcus sp.]
MKKLSKSQFLQVSIMLFGLFFGAGNLIFPPLLGAGAADKTLIALLAFAITAVLFPVMGAIVVSKTEGLNNLSSRVGPSFAIVFTTAIYLSIGPGLGIPRAGSVPFEMAIAPYISETSNLVLLRGLYTLVFFAIALAIALKPSKLAQRVGKYLTPALLLLILIMFIKISLMPKDIGEAIGAYKTSPITEGFIQGYNTMDAVAALNFGFVISLTIRRFGIKDKKDVTNYTIKSGLLAGSVLFIVYALLASIGMFTSLHSQSANNGAEILANATRAGFGRLGLILLIAIFTLACLTTCVGLISSGGEYFSSLFNHKLSYRAWVYIWTIFSFIMANFGLNTLLEFSVPLLSAIYPVALLLIVMGMTHELIDYPSLAYKLSAYTAVILPILTVLTTSFGLNLGFVTDLLQGLPLYDQGLHWLLPSLIVLILSSFGGKLLKTRGKSLRQVEVKSR